MRLAIDFKAIADSTYDCECLLAADGRFLYISPSCRRLTGYSRQAFMRTPGLFLDIIHAEDRRMVARYLQTCRRPCPPQSLEFRILHRSGRVRWLHKMGQAMLDADSEYLGRRMSLRDITKRKKAELALCSARAALEKRVRHRTVALRAQVAESGRLRRLLQQVQELERQRFGRDLHDGVGQLLTSLILRTDHLAAKVGGGHDQLARDAGEISRQLRQLAGQVRDIAKMSNPVHIAKDGLGAALRQLAAGASQQYGIDCQYAGPLGYHMGGAGQAVHLYRIAQEAIQNAIKHGGARRVHMAIECRGLAHRLLIQDDGAGLPQAPTSRQGIGLQIMHQRARMIKAVVRIFTRPEGGVAVECSWRGRPRAPRATKERLG